MLQWTIAIDDKIPLIVCRLPLSLSLSLLRRLTYTHSLQKNIASFHAQVIEQSIKGHESIKILQKTHTHTTLTASNRLSRTRHCQTDLIFVSFKLVIRAANG